MAENREYRSDVFSMLMEDKSYALQVYNALNGSDYDDPQQVEVLSLEGGISLSIRTDCAFIVDMNLNIYEHQSTYNPNMPLRLLVYFTSYVKNMIKGRYVFGPKLIKIPTPHFAVFYNGLKDRPEREVIRLSMAYEKPTDKPELELICTVYNINTDKDKEIRQKCAVIDEYMQFIETVRMYEADGADAPVERAIRHCISCHILEDFLIRRGAEVLKQMTFDWTYERQMELAIAEASEDAREEERKNTERERKRADEAEKRAEAAERRVAELEAML